jgi:hypothetical protein
MLLPSKEVKKVFTDEDIPEFAFDCKLNSNIPLSGSSSEDEKNQRLKTHPFFIKPQQKKRDAKV